MKTSYVLSVALKVIGVVFLLEALVSVPLTIPAIAIYVNGIGRLSHESAPAFSFMIIIVAWLMLFCLFLTSILIIYSDRIAKYLVKSNDRDLVLKPHWVVPDILFISIQIIAILIVVKGIEYLLENTAKGVCLLFYPDIFNEVLDSRMRLQMGGESIAGLFIFIFGVVLFLYSHKITNFLDRFNRKKGRPNKALNSDG